jgi:ADP-ribose pyrophosphatase YjhB (NUDIX family)
MNPHEQAIKILAGRGFYAKRRDWAPGATVIVSRCTKRVEEIDQLDGMIVLVWRDTTWDLQAPLSTPGGVIEHGYSTSNACERAMEYLNAPEDQLRAVYRDAQNGIDGSTVEYWFPDCLPIQSQLHPTENG